MVLCLCQRTMRRKNVGIDARHQHCSACMKYEAKKKKKKADKKAETTTANENKTKAMPSFSRIVSDASDANSAPSDVSADAADEDSSEEVSSDSFHGVISAVARSGLDPFLDIFNMSRRTFEYVCSLVRDPMILDRDFVFSDGRPMLLNDQVAVALRRLSSGTELHQIGGAIRVSPLTVDKIAWKFVQVIRARGRNHLRWPESRQQLEAMKLQFEHSYGLPNCCGVVDVTHVRMVLSGSERDAYVWRDYENNHSMVAMGIVDPNYRFLELHTGMPGMLTDSMILQDSKFFQSCQNGEMLNGEKVKLSDRADMQEYIIGDEGFPLLPWLMTPYQGTNLEAAQAEFNERLMVARQVSQIAFARLKKVWKMIDGSVLSPDEYKLPWYIDVCCILHNIIIDMQDEVLDPLLLLPDHDPGYITQPEDFADDGAVVSRDLLSKYIAERMKPLSGDAPNN